MFFDENNAEQKNRSKFADLVSFTNASFFVVCFILIYGVTIYQLDFWQVYFFKDTVDFSDSCKFVAAKDNRSEVLWDVKGKPLQFIKIPHRAVNPFEKINSLATYRHIYYRCELNTKRIADGNGASLLHTGWMMGDRNVVMINGHIRADFMGSDKALVTLTSEDMASGEVLVEAYSVREKNDRLGLSGGTPLIVAKGVNINSRVLGIEFALSSIRPLFRLLPVLILALVIFIGWLLGIRSRLSDAVLFYFAFVATRNLGEYLVDFSPLDRLMHWSLLSSLKFGEYIAYLCFGFELISVFGRYIRWLKLLSLLITISLAALYLLSVRTTKIDDAITNIYVLMMVSSSLALALMVWRSEQRFSLDPGRILLNRIFCGATLLFATITLTDSVLFYFGINVVLANQRDVIMPLFVGALLLYRLASVQSRYEQERLAREKMHNELELAREIQDSLSLPAPKSHFGDFFIDHYQIKHSEVAGDWLAVRGLGERGMAILEIDVTGKGMQAALIVHAVQSLWAEALYDNSFDPDQWIRKVNRTLFRLGEKRPHSATLGLIMLCDNTIRYYCLGHTPLFIVTKAGDAAAKVNASTARGDVLGLKAEVQMKPYELQLPQDVDISILLGSDGVFANGSRTKPREVTTLLEGINEKGNAALVDCDETDDRTLVHIYRKRKVSLAS